MNPPSFEGYDGGAGSRYQCRREVRSFWYPTWLAQPAAMVPGSKLIDAPPDDLTWIRWRRWQKSTNSIVLHTSTPSFNNDARFAARLKEENPDVLVGMVGAHVGVLPEPSLRGRAGGGLGQRRRVRLHLRRRRVRASRIARDRRTRVSRTATDRAYARAPDDHGHGRLSVGARRLPPRPDDPELLQRLLAASVYLALHGARLQVAVHVLPLAADDRRASLSRAQRRQRRRRDGAGEGRSSPRCASISSTTIR